ncbi:MAG TPA: class I SAM-dependent methyltransferase [Candidatus Angelobacter sp.]|nr:class I SAM-dependent methyltransferase [Candidatus Angelobacter sp.]
MPEKEMDFDRLKQRLRTTWMTGDFGKIAEYTAKGAAEFVSRIGIHSGGKVLDVACGTGNLAIPAARLGAQVTGIDIALNLLEQARQRAASEKLSAVFEEGDAEKLPYPSASFDVVMTMFGAMFAPRPNLVAAELLRVCRPGGTIAMANWTREGFVGKQFATTSRHVPPPPDLPPPVLWGDEATVKDRLSDGCSQIGLVRRMIEFDYPFPPAHVVEFFREYFGPTQAAFARLDANGQELLAADLEALWRENNQAGGNRTLIHAEYLEVMATKK